METIKAILWAIMIIPSERATLKLHEVILGVVAQFSARDCRFCA